MLCFAFRFKSKISVYETPVIAYYLTILQLYYAVQIPMSFIIIIIIIIIIIRHTIMLAMRQHEYII